MITYTIHAQKKTFVFFLAQIFKIKLIKIYKIILITPLADNLACFKEKPPIVTKQTIFLLDLQEIWTRNKTKYEVHTNLLHWDYLISVPEYY